jgi:lysozyme family protein
MSTFDQAVPIVLDIEGPPSNAAADSGGLTVYGHDQASWPSLLARVPLEVRAQLPPSVATLTRDQAVLAYRAGYWDWLHCDDLPAELALIAFDAAVNQGQNWAPRSLQQALGVTQDGAIGPETLHAADLCDRLDILTEFGWLREQRYRLTVNWAVYGHGWIKGVSGISCVGRRLTIRPPWPG